MFKKPYSDHLENLKDIKNILIRITEEIDFPDIKNKLIHHNNDIELEPRELIKFAEELKSILKEITKKIEEKISYLEKIVINPQSYEIDNIKLKKNYDSRTYILEINWKNVKSVINKKEKQINSENLNRLDKLNEKNKDIMFQSNRLDEIIFDLKD